MTINTYLITSCTKHLLSRLEGKVEINDSEITTSFKTLLYRGKTYEAIEIAKALTEKGIIPQEILIDIAYLHYIKMKNSNINPKYIEDHISRYPEIKSKKL